MAKNYPKKTKDDYGEKLSATRVGRSNTLAFEAAKGNIDLHYDPQGSGETHDPFFASVAPGVADSGNLKHKWGEPGAHWGVEEPPQDLAGD